jgi:hypothetical protein
VQAGGEAAATQLDPVAWVGNVALALPGFETTPLAFVFDPQHEGAAPAFYGADVPAGWQGLARTALFAPDPDAANGQGFGQALYLKGHWFDSGSNAREWCLTGKPLLEASGNGNYVDHTGEAGFGIQRTVWGTSFPTPDNPDVIIQRAIAWFRRRHVVIEATLDAYCLAAAASNRDSVAPLAAVVPGAAESAGAAGRRAGKAAGQPFGASCDGLIPYLNEELGPLLDASLEAAETGSTLTRYVPVPVGTPVVQVDLTRYGDQAINRFGDSAEQRARRADFGLDAMVHHSGQYAGVDADGNPQYVFTNTWFVELYREGEVLLLDDLVDVVANSDEQNGAERTEVPSLTLSGEGWAITANAFTFPQPDGTTLGGVEVRAAKDSAGDDPPVVATAAVVTPRPPGTTPQGVADEFVQRATEAVCDPSAPPDAKPDVEAQIMFLALFLNLDYLSLGSALAGGGFVDVRPEEMAIEVAPEGGEPPVGRFMGIGSTDPAANPPATLC